MKVFRNSRLGSSQHRFDGYDEGLEAGAKRILDNYGIHNESPINNPSVVRWDDPKYGVDEWHMWFSVRDSQDRSLVELGRWGEVEKVIKRRFGK